MKAKIYLPASFDVHKDLPAIFLIDFTEQHFKMATDEFEKVVAGVEKIGNLDALVVSLENIPDIDAEPQSFQEHYKIYRDLALHVHGTYTNNTARTLIGKEKILSVFIGPILRQIGYFLLIRVNIRH